MQQRNRIRSWFLYQSRRPAWPPVRGYPEGLCEMPGEWSAGRINPPESCRDRRPWRRGVPVWSSRFFQYVGLLHFGRPHGGAPTILFPHHVGLLHFGRPRGGAPTISLPHHADLVYFAGGHIGAPLQYRYRIMWI